MRKDFNCIYFMKDALNNGEKARVFLCVSLSCLWLELNVSSFIQKSSIRLEFKGLD